MSKRFRVELVPVGQEYDTYMSFDCLACGCRETPDEDQDDLYFTERELDRWAAGAPITHSNFDFSCDDLYLLHYGLCRECAGEGPARGGCVDPHCRRNWAGR